MEAVTTHTPGDTDSRDVLFEVTGMTCGNCVAHVERALAGQDGVEGAAVDLASGQARVTVTRAVSTDRLVEAVAAAGYTLSALEA